MVIGKNCELSRGAFRYLCVCAVYFFKSERYER